jgi:hypothetical protein
MSDDTTEPTSSAEHDETPSVEAPHPYIGTKRRWIRQSTSMLFDTSPRRPTTPFTVEAMTVRYRNPPSLVAQMGVPMEAPEPIVGFEIIYDDGGRSKASEIDLADNSEPYTDPERVFEFTVRVTGMGRRTSLAPMADVVLHALRHARNAWLDGTEFDIVQTKEYQR